MVWRIGETKRYGVPQKGHLGAFRSLMGSCACFAPRNPRRNRVNLVFVVAGLTFHRRRFHLGIRAFEDELGGCTEDGNPECDNPPVPVTLAVDLGGLLQHPTTCCNQRLQPDTE